MRRIIAGLLLLLVTASCTEGSGPAAGPPAVSIEDSVPTLTEGEDYEVVSQVASEIDGRAATLVGLTGDGTEVYVRHAHRADGDTEDDDPYAVALVTRDPTSGRTTVLSDRAKRQGPVARDRIPGNALQIVSVAVTRDLAVWVEASNLTHGDLYVYDIGNGVERRLVPSSALASGATPVLHGEHVYFVGVDGKDLDATPLRTSVYRVPLDGSGTPEPVARGAVDVHSPGDGSGDRLRVVFADRVVDWDPDGGTDGEVAGTSLPAGCGAAAAEGVTIVCHGTPNEITIDTVNGRIEPAGVSGTVHGLQASSQWVAFTTDADGDRGQYVFDIGREKLVTMPPSRFLRVFAPESPHLAVMESPEAGSPATVIELVR